MTEKELQKYLKKEYPKEAEYCEWKEFKGLKHSVSGKVGDDVVSYISAISNMEGGHLVIGVEDATLTIVGIQDLHNYTPENIKLKILEQCPNLSSEGLWVETFKSSDTNKIVWIFHIPKHLPRKPVMAHNKKWQRVEDSLVEMRPEREQAILFEAVPAEPDWFAATLAGIKETELDKTAITKARKEYKKNHPKLSKQVDGWSTLTFLKKVGLIIDGKITRAAILLLGTKELAIKLKPIVTQITYDSRNQKGISNPGASAHIYPPFILAADKILELISNSAIRQMPVSTAYPDVITKYDNWVIREALHNCIAHQDYFKKERIVVVEHPDYLLFENAGSFLPGSVEKVIENDAPSRNYRNGFLCEAMVELNMIDTVGSGIKKMFTTQMERYLPLPSFDLSQHEVTRVTICNNVIDPNFALVLRTKKDITLHDVISLDKIQKGILPDDSEIVRLKYLGIIEGKKPGFKIKYSGLERISAVRKDLTYDEFKGQMMELFKNFEKVTRADIEKLFMPMLPDSLSIDKKKKKLTNMVYKLAKVEGIIVNISDSTKFPVWIINEDRKDSKVKPKKAK